MPAVVFDLLPTLTLYLLAGILTVLAAQVKSTSVLSFTIDKIIDCYIFVVRTVKPESLSSEHDRVDSINLLGASLFLWENSIGLNTNATNTLRTMRKADQLMHNDFRV